MSSKLLVEVLVAVLPFCFFLFLSTHAPLHHSTLPLLPLLSFLYFHSTTFLDSAPGAQIRNQQPIHPRKRRRRAFSSAPQGESERHGQATPPLAHCQGQRPRSFKTRRLPARETIGSGRVRQGRVMTIWSPSFY